MEHRQLPSLQQLTTRSQQEQGHSVRERGSGLPLIQIQPDHYPQRIAHNYRRSHLLLVNVRQTQTAPSRRTHQHITSTPRGRFHVTTQPLRQVTIHIFTDRINSHLPRLATNSRPINHHIAHLRARRLSGRNSAGSKHGPRSHT